MTGQVIAFPGCQLPEAPEPVEEETYDDWRARTEENLVALVRLLELSESPSEWVARAGWMCSLLNEGIETTNRFAAKRGERNR